MQRYVENGENIRAFLRNTTWGSLENPSILKFWPPSYLPSFGISPLLPRTLTSSYFPLAPFAADLENMRQTRPDTILSDPIYLLKHHARCGPRRPIPSRLVPEIDITDDTVRNCVNCSDVIYRGEENEEMFAYKLCGCVSLILRYRLLSTDPARKVACSDCVDASQRWICFAHAPFGLQPLLKIYGMRCQICQDQFSMLTVGSCGAC